MQRKTLRLVYPQWQGGDNPDYYFGGNLLQYIVPSDNDAIVYKVGVEKPDLNKKKMVEKDGIVGETALLKNALEVKDILNKEKPVSIIVLGGDCSISRMPFDYLSGKYKEKLGVLWLDAHPDISTTSTSNHYHEMVVSHLLGYGSGALLENMKNPLKTNQIFMVGIVEEDLREKDMDLKRKKINYLTPEDIPEKIDKLLEWIDNEGIEYLAIHMDLDVLSPNVFRSIYPGEPGLESFDAAIGKLTFKDLRQILKEVQKKAQIVGYSIAEFLPWDEMNLNKLLSEVDIFKGE